MLYGLQSFREFSDSTWLKNTTEEKLISCSRCHKMWRKLTCTFFIQADFDSTEKRIVVAPAQRIRYDNSLDLKTEFLGKRLEA